MLKIKQLLQSKVVGKGAPTGREGSFSEVQITVVGTGAVSAKVKLWGSIDQVGFIDLGTVALSGTDNASMSDNVSRMYPVLVAEITEITGTNVEVMVTMAYDDEDE